MQALLCFPSAPAPERSSPHSSAHAQPRTAAALHPVVRSFLCGVGLHLAQAPTAARLAGCHAPALTAPTTSLAVDLRVPAQPPPKAAHNTQHEPVECLPSPRSPREPLTHTRGSSPTSGGVAPRLPARFVATSPCQQAKQRYPRLAPLDRQACCTSPRWLKAGNHRQRPRAS